MTIFSVNTIIIVVYLTIINVKKVMIKNLEFINNSIEYIEENLTNEIDYQELARISRLSVYEFRRIFSIIIGYAPAEYIRKRRLTKSAMEIKAGAKIDDAFSEKYGYHSVQTFVRAFKEYYNVSPYSLLAEDVMIKSFNPPNVCFALEKEVDLDYTLITLDDFIIQSVYGLSSIDDTVCCESVWNKFYGIDQLSLQDYSCDDKAYAVYYNSRDGIDCNIGIKTKEQVNIEKLSAHKIKGGKFISFSCPLSETEQNVNRLYENILLKFLPYSPFEYDKNRANIEIFPLSKGQNFNILIPIIYKN